MSQLWRAIGTDALAIVNATSGNETVPLTRMAAGRNVTVRRVDSSAYTVTVTVTSGLSLDGVLNGTTTVAVNSEKQFLAVDGGFESFGGPTPGSIGSVELADGSVAAVDLAAGVAPALAANVAFTGTYAPLSVVRASSRKADSWVLVGDSITQRATNKAFWAYARSFLKRRVRLIANAAVGGATSAAQLAIWDASVTTTNAGSSSSLSSGSDACTPKSL